MCRLHWHKTIQLSKYVFLVGLICLQGIAVFADEQSARLGMESPDNPLVLISTSQGAIYVELFPSEAPLNVANFISLAEGQTEIRDQQTGAASFPHYYDNLRFHRVIPNFLIQAGSPVNHPVGALPRLLKDEINAGFLGLNEIPVINPDGSVNSLLNVGGREILEELLLVPLYRAMGVRDASELDSRQPQIAERMRAMTISELYQILGYSYQDGYPSRAVDRGVLALANDGPNRNGAEFFIPVVNAAWLTGRYTVIGKVVEGMEIVDRINSFPVDPQIFTRQSTIILSMRRL